MDFVRDDVLIKLQEAVDNEDKHNPFSDDALADEFAKHGFNLARRAVTKFRKALDIPSFRQRQVDPNPSTPPSLPRWLKGFRTT